MLRVMPPADRAELPRDEETGEEKSRDVERAAAS
jgi:hypothetical protein